MTSCQASIANDRRKWRWRDGDCSAQDDRRSYRRAWRGWRCKCRRHVGNKCRKHVGNKCRKQMSETNVGNMSEIKLSDRQQIIVSIIRSNPTVSAKQMSETSRTIERDCQGYKRSFKDFYWLIFLESKTFYTLTIYPNTSKFTKSNYSKACCLHSCSSNVLN